ncbi:bystin [Galendromus occidentalis]|uniref:Bystin n=1 Tax=Galendromus occidentalis TaxID=34638 RepID=A0AAJ6QY35_9ACAR|nr:bystin [Galendromus occidentalis]
MGKADRIVVTKRVRHAPLADQMESDEVVTGSGRTKNRRKKDSDVTNDEYVGSRLSKNILAQARQQQQALEESHETPEDSDRGRRSHKRDRMQTSTLASDSEGEDFEESQERQEYDAENFEIDEDAARQMELFMNMKQEQRKTLADIIMERLAAKSSEIKTQFSDGAHVEDMDPKVAEMYDGVRVFLSRYRAGKLPKAFKIIPSLQNWEQVLFLTDPDNWTAASVYQATRLFASNLKERMAQRFYNLVLLPRVRDDIDEYKRLNFHLYQALRKAIFKPAAFFKGIILPLCESGTCTLREAIIVSSVITRNSVPYLHACACMLRLAEMEYSGANSIFLRVLIDKKYTLPYRVVDALVYHFLRFENDRRELPVLWHQCFLTFAQRYKQDVSEEQKEALLKLLKVHNHPQITNDIRYELNNSTCRESSYQAESME